MKTKTILIVDDEKNIRLAMSQALEPLGVPVRTAVDGEEAMEILSSGTSGLVFLDLKMPGMDGMEVLRRIKETRPEIRVIIISAHGTVTSAVEAMKLGAVDFIQKPFTPGEIRELALRVIGRDDLTDETAVGYGDLIELAKRHLSDRNFIAAHETARKAVAADPGQAEAYNLLGVLLEIKGAWVEAQKFYRAALEIDPTHKPSRANLERTTSMEKRGRIQWRTD
jgi:DNA-binding NtrC family response regulator